MSVADPLTLPAPSLDQFLAPAGKWAKEYEAFQRLLPELLKTHRGQYVVIHEGRVVDSGTDDLALALRFFAAYGNVPIHVGFVTDQPPVPEHIPHYREVPHQGGAS
jgi:hypothetical protein